MVVWFASGQSLLAWLGPVLRFAGRSSCGGAAVGVRVAMVHPQIARSASQLHAARRCQPCRPRAFHRVGQRDRVFFVESVNFEDARCATCSSACAARGSDGVIVAAKGQIEVAPNGDRFLVLEQGRRYEGRPGSAEYRTMEFNRYSIRIESRPDRPLGERSARTKPMSELLAEATPFAKAELLWRIGIPVAALVVTLLAIPLAYTNPRVGRSFNLIIAVLAFADLPQRAEYRAGLGAAGPCEFQPRRVGRPRGSAAGGGDAVCAARLHAALVAAATDAGLRRRKSAA